MISPIPPDRVGLVSDKQWKTIVEKKWSPEPHRSKQMGKDLVGMASAETFAQNLAAVARVQPQRVARLALDFPITIDPHYVWSLFRAFAETKPPEPAAGAAEWAPAPAEMLEQFVDRFSSSLREGDCWTRRSHARRNCR